MSATPTYWRVIAPPPWAKIAGTRRRMDDVFQATEFVARFLVLEGVLAPCDALGALLPPPGSYDPVTQTELMHNL